MEGTILTVINEAAKAARQAAQQGANLTRMMDEVVLCAKATIERTPELLPVLKEAGVVEAGGQGLYYVLEAMRSCAWEEGGASLASARGQAVSPLLGAEQSYGYEIQLIIYPKGHSPAQGLPLQETRRRMGEMGESVLVVGDESLIRVHVHTPRPDRVLAYALDLGRVEDVSVENLDQQVRSVASERRGGC